MIRLTRVYSFCASHRLHSAELTDEENREAYGKCNNPYGHGHNYRLEVTIAGAVDERSGKVIDIPALDGLVSQSVLRLLDHKNLNRELPEFQKLVPTSENLVLVIDRKLRENWNAHLAGSQVRLDNVRLSETRRNRFELRHEDE